MLTEMLDRFDSPFNLLGTPVWLEHAPWVAAVLWFFAVGGCVGSFLNVVALRGARGEDVVFRPSGCPVCGGRIRAWHNLPIVGFLMLGGRCYDCHVPIPIRYFLWELAFGVLFAVVGTWAASGYLR